MFAGIVPLRVEWALYEAKLTLYSARLRPAKGGAMLSMGANFQHKRNESEPLDQRLAKDLRVSLKAALSKKGYKSRVKCFWDEYAGAYDYSDFRVDVILPKNDYDEELYEDIKRIYKSKKRRRYRARDL